MKANHGPLTFESVTIDLMADSSLDARGVVARAHDVAADRAVIGRDVAEVVRALAAAAGGSAVAVADIDAIGGAAADRPRILLVASPSMPEGRALTRDEIDRLIAATPRDGLVIIDESLSEFASSPRAAFAAPLSGPAMTDPRLAVVRGVSRAADTDAPRAGYAITAPEVAARTAPAEPTAAQLAEIVRCLSPDGLDDIFDRADWIRAERQHIERTLRDRMEKAELERRPFIDIVHSDADAVWLPVGPGAESLGAHAGGTVHAGRGVRYEIGSDGDAFIDAVSEWVAR